jgi:hypothetical protein
MVENLATALCSLKEVLDNLSAQNNQVTIMLSNFNKFLIDIASISMQNKQNLIDTMSFYKL